MPTTLQNSGRDALAVVLTLLQPGTVAVIAGESGAGKTTFALNLARTVAADRPVTFLYYENADIVRRRLSWECPGVRGIHAAPDYGETVLGPEAVADCAGLVVVEGIGRYAKTLWHLLPQDASGIRPVHEAVPMAIERFASVAKAKNAALLVTLTMKASVNGPHTTGWVPSEFSHLQTKRFPLLDWIDVCGWLKPVHGWTYRKNPIGAASGGELRLFKPEPDVLRVSPVR